MVLADTPAPPIIATGPTSTTIERPALHDDTGPAVIPVTITIGDPGEVINGCAVLELVWSWGASSDAGVLTSADAGSGTLRLLDPLRLFDPANAAGAVADLGSVIRLYFGDAVTGVPAFRGRIDDLDHDLTMATVAIVDSVASLAAIQFVETAVPAESASARIGRILDLAGWPLDRRDIGPGGVALQAGSVAADAWSEMIEVTRNELGALWLTPAGKVAWRNRATAWAGGDPLATFGCQPSDAFVSELSTRADGASLVNVLAAARTGGTQRIVTDADSLARYGRKSHVQNDLALASDGDRDLWQSFYLVRQASPARGVGSFRFRPDLATAAKVLSLPLGGIVRVFDEHHGPVIDRKARWLGARWTVAPAYIEVAATTGEEASIRAVARSLVIDTPTEWQAAAGSAADDINVAYREPGVAPAALPALGTNAAAKPGPATKRATKRAPK